MPIIHYLFICKLTLVWSHIFCKKNMTFLNVSLDMLSPICFPFSIAIWLTNDLKCNEEGFSPSRSSVNLLLLFSCHVLLNSVWKQTKIANGSKESLGLGFRFRNPFFSPCHISEQWMNILWDVFNPARPSADDSVWNADRVMFKFFVFCLSAPLFPLDELRSPDYLLFFLK